MYLMRSYDRLLQQILDEGKISTNQRTQLSTLHLVGAQSRYFLGSPDKHFPLLTKRKVWPRAIFAELCWMLSGSTSNLDLVQMGSNIWTPWVDEAFEAKQGYGPGELGPIYGYQMRNFGGKFPDRTGGVDQIHYLIREIQRDRSSRRILMNLWNPLDLPKMRLPPCHYAYQVLINDAGELSGVLSMRSCDVPIGLPANVQFYAALTIMLAEMTGYRPYELVVNCADAHIYENQIEPIQEYLLREEKESPKLQFHNPGWINVTPDCFQIQDYQPHPAIKIPVAV